MRLMIGSILILSVMAAAGITGETTPPAIDTIYHESSTLTPDTAHLTVEGSLSGKSQVFLSLNTLMAFPQVSFTLVNTWSGKEETFTGTSLIQLLNTLGMKKEATIVEVVAANDYRVLIRRNDIEKIEYILSYKVNHTLYADLPPKQNKGPLAIAINFAKHKEIDREIYKHQLVWFVKKIIIK